MNITRLSIGQRTMDTINNIIIFKCFKRLRWNRFSKTTDFGTDDT